MPQNYKNILVTGGAGFIGSNFIQFLLDQDNTVNIYNLDALTYSGRFENLSNLPDPARHTFIKGNINQQELVIELLTKYQIDLVVNFAAETHVDRSILDPSKFIQTNITGTYNLLEASRKVLQDKSVDNLLFLHISTDEVFGELGPDDPPFSESTPYSPNSPYAASKAASDHLVRAYYQTFQLPILITNCSNNYGPYQFPEKFIPLVITHALAGEALPIYGDGQQIRDWLYVLDHCQAVWLIAQKGRIGHTYLIGGGNQKTNLQIVKMICSLLDDIAQKSDGKSYADQIRFVKDRPGHDQRYSINFSKINDELGWTPQISLEKGLRKTIYWYLENRSWVNAITANDDYQAWLSKNYTEWEKTE